MKSSHHVEDRAELSIMSRQLTGKSGGGKAAFASSDGDAHTQLPQAPVNSDGISYGLEFKDPLIREKYFLFRTGSNSRQYVFSIACFFTAGYIFYWGLALHSFLAPVSVLLSVLSGFFSLLLMWVVVFLRYRFPIYELQTNYRNLLVLLESITMMGVVVTTGLVLTMRSTRYCTSTEFTEIWSCVPSYDIKRVPFDTSIFLLAFPFILSIGFPFVPGCIIFLSLFIGVAFLVALLIYLQSLVPSTTAIVLILFNIFLVIFSRLQHMELFLFTTKYYEVVKHQSQEQRDLAKKIRDEMRNLISSVSHDLKSVSFTPSLLFLFFDSLPLSFSQPLSAFIHGFEGFRQSLSDASEIILGLNSGSGSAAMHLTADNSKLHEAVSFMTVTLNSLIGTYQVLLMTINRFTDYTKISHDITLCPLMESVHLLDSLIAPISCVQDLQSKIAVELQPIDSNISEFIITDRQWLQDNVLCLVTNAVKFSVQGKAILRVSLVPGITF
jgi:hypothetical protein